MDKEYEEFLIANMLENICSNYGFEDFYEEDDPELLIKNSIKTVLKQGIGMKGEEIEDYAEFEWAVWKEIEKWFGD